MKQKLVFMLFLFTVATGSVQSQAIDGMKVLRGDVHSHTRDSDGAATLTEAFNWANSQPPGTTYFAISDHCYDTQNANDGLTANKLEAQRVLVEQNNAKGNTLFMLAYELTYHINSGYWGHLNIINLNRLYSTFDYNLPFIYEDVGSKYPQAIIQWNHPNYQWGCFDDYGHWTTTADKVVRLIEHRCNAVQDQMFRLALAKGWHVSPIWNSDTHERDWTRRGAVIVPDQPNTTPEDILDAFRKNRTFTATEETLEIFYKVNNEWMGARLQDPEQLNISVTVKTGGANMTRMQLVTEQGMIVNEVNFNATAYTWNFTINPDFDYYYVRVYRGSSEIGVSAPVWIEGRDKIELTDIGLGLETSATPHVVKVNVKNKSQESLSNVKVDYYLSGINGFTLSGTSTATPAHTATIGTMSAGDERSASGFFNYTQANRYVTVIVSATDTRGKKYTSTLHTVLSPIYVTEVLPRMTAQNGVSNPFQYIELYNNSNTVQSLSGYRLQYYTNPASTTMHNWNLTGSIQPQSTAVIWVQTTTNNLTVADFNARFGTNLTLNQNIFIVKGNALNSLSGKYAHSASQFELYNGNEVLVRFQYNWALNYDKVVLNQPVVFAYQNKFTVTQKPIYSYTTPKPGTLQNDNLVPSTAKIEVESVKVTSLFDVTEITTPGGSLQMLVDVLPVDATNRTVNWTAMPMSHATINANGMLTAINNGTVTVRATADDGSGKYGEMTIAISGQPQSVSSITVSGEGGATTITAPGGTLQMIADVLPEDAINKSVTWSVTPFPGIANISNTGLLAATGNGRVTVRATATDGSAKYGLTTITISGQTGMTGVEQPFAQNLGIFPNPFTDALHITGADDCTLRIIDASGSVVHIQKITGANEMIRLKQLSAGVYFFRVEKDEQSITVKIVKE